MKKLAALAAGVAILAFAVPAFAKSDNAAYRGEAGDPSYPQLGVISYLSNNSGYHFWFTMTANLGPYIEGHSYHNVYKVQVDDPSEWCGPIPVGGSPARPPYNEVGHEGESVYYKIYDTTTDTLICP